MGININSFSKDKNSVEVTENLPTAVQEENFDIMEYTNNKKNELRKSKEVEALTSLIEVENPDTILQFGRKASEG
ncbi:TPA: toxic anion resistance protein, partial [Clostridioides difficile]|nr:toxic anion resistance protein [Clostridioides difficile]